MITSVSRHLDLYHKFDTSIISFIALAVIPRDPRGGDWDTEKKLWIERLNALQAPGLNEAQSYRPFL